MFLLACVCCILLLYTMLSATLIHNTMLDQIKSKEKKLLNYITLKSGIINSNISD